MTDVTTTDSETPLGTVVDRLVGTRRVTEALAAPLSEADQTVQSMADTSPTKWHRAHTTWFFETFILGPYSPEYQPFDENFSYLFNSYYEAVGERYPRPQRGMLTRPGASQIGEYRHYVDEALQAMLARGDEAQIAQLRPLIELGINHEQQHQELLLMDIKHALANNVFDTVYDQRAHEPVREAGPLGWRSIEGGKVDIGYEPNPSTSSKFRFDNEEPRHAALIHTFELADRLISCGEWLEFMADGGYDEAQLWLSDGWYTRLSEGWKAPLYWSQTDEGEWHIHTLTGTRPVDPHEPVCHISFYEADAYATWAGARLPTEFEWEQAASKSSTEGALLAPHDVDGMSTVEASRLHPDGAGSVAGSLRQMFGDCWEWTGSPYRPYPGYKTPDGAIGEYNGKFMINTMVLRGGCALTPAGHMRSSYRNFFHPHTRWHLSGVRLARD